MKYKDIVTEAKRRYPDDIWNQVAFENGATWLIRQQHPDKDDLDRVFDEMEVPRTTMD